MLAAEVDIQGSNSNVGIEYAPCLTRARGSALAFWSLQHARALTVSELMRLQGFDPGQLWLNVTPNQMGALLGNAFTGTVCAAVMDAALKAAEM